MSFHQLKLQKDALHSLYQIPLNTNEAPHQTPTNINNATTKENDISELECGESWTTMSEIDSQYSRHSSIRFGGMELSMITDSDDGGDSDNDGVDAGRPAPLKSRVKKHQPLLPAIISTPTGDMNTKGFNNDDHQRQHQSMATASIIDDARVISPRDSDGLSSPPQPQSSGFGKQRLVEAEGQVVHAREELARVTKDLEELQERHDTKVFELQEQLAAANQKEEDQQPLNRAVAAEVHFDDRNQVAKNENLKSQQSESKDKNMDAGGVAVFDLDYEDQLEIAQNQKLVAESKLDDAIKKLRLVESEKQKMAKATHELQTKLETTLEKVNFAEDQNSILEFRVGEYKTKWEDSLERARWIESKLVTTRCDLESAIRLAEKSKEQCEMTVSNAAAETAKERSLREQHARSEHHTAERLNAQCQQNKQCQREKLELEQAVQSLERERSGIQNQLEKTTSRRNDVEANLSKAKDECYQLTSELKTLQISMALLESDFEQKQMKLQESLDVQLKHLRTSNSVLAAKDIFNEKKLSERETEALKIKADAKATQLIAQAQFREEERLLSELKESRDKAQEQKESLGLELEMLQKCIDALIEKDELNQKISLEHKTEILKLKTDSKTAKLEAQTKYDEEQRRSEEMEQQLLSDLKESRDNARLQKNSLNLKLEELRKSIETLLAKDKLNQKLLLEKDTNMLKLKTDSETSKLEVRAEHDEEQRRSGEMAQELLSALKESRDEVEEQKESSDLELEELRKSIDALVAKDELELEELRKSIDALSVKDELNEKVISEYKEEELKLKADSKTAKMEAQEKYEEEQLRSADVEQQLLFDLENSHAKAKSLQLEKDTLEEVISTLKEGHISLNEELTTVNGRWKATEVKAKRLDEEKRLLSAGLTASRYSVLRLESERSGVFAERGALIESHRLELTKQQSVLSSSQKIEQMLKKELNVIQKNRRSLEQDKADLKTQLHTVGNVHGKLVEMHEASMQEFQAKIKELKLENDCLEKDSFDLELAKLDIERQLGKRQEEFETLQQTQNDTKLELHRRSKEYDDFSKASFDRYKILETERSELQERVGYLYSKELGLEEKLRTLVDVFEASNAKLSEKEKVEDEREDLLLKERNTITQLEDELLEFMGKTTSMSVGNARSLLEREKETTAAQAMVQQIEAECINLKADIALSTAVKNEVDATIKATKGELARVQKAHRKSEDKVLRIEEECINLKSDIALTTAKKSKLDGELKAVKDEFTHLQEAYLKSEEKIAELLFIQKESKMSSEREIAGLMNRLKRLETEKTVSDRIRIELEETLKVTMASWGKSKRALLDKENEFRNLEIELTKSMANVKDLEQQQALLVAEKNADANEKYSMVTLHSKRMKDHEASVASLKEELEVTRMDVLKTKREKRELHKMLVAEKEDAANEKRSMITLHSKRMKDQEASVASLKKELEVTRMDALKIRREEEELQKMLVWEKEDAANEKNLMISLHSKRMKDHEASVAFLKEKLEVTRMDVLKTSSRNKELQKITEELGIKESLLEEKCDETMRLLNNTKRRLEDAEEEKILLYSELRGQSMLIENAIVEKEKYQESLEASEKEIDELRSKYVTAQSSIDLFGTSLGKLEKERSKLEVEIGVARKREKWHVNELRTTSEEIAFLKSSEEALVLEHKHTIDRLETSKTAIVSENDKIMSELQPFKEQQLKLEHQRDIAEKKSFELNRKLNDCEALNSKLVIERDHARLQIESLESKQEILQKKVENVEAAKTASENNAESNIRELKKESDRLIANCNEAKGTITARLSIDINQAKSTIVTLQTKAKEAAKENSRLIANSVGTIAALQKEIQNSAKQNSRLVSNLKTAEGTITIVESKAKDSSKKNALRFESMKNNLKDATGTIATLESEAKCSAKQNARIIASLKTAKGTIATLESEAKDSTKENGHLFSKINNDLIDAKGTIATLESKVKCTAKENACLIVNLNNDLKVANGTIATLESEARNSANENVRLITNIKDDLKDAKGTIATLESEAKDSAKESACLIASIENALKVAKRTIVTLESEAKGSAKESSRRLANIKDNLKVAECTIVSQESEAKCSAKENACITANLNNDLKDAKDTIVTLESDAKDSAKESARIIAKIKGELKDAKGTIATLESKVKCTAKENAYIIAKIKEDLKDANGTIVTLESEAKDSAKESARLNTKMKDDLKDAKVTIATLQSEARDSAKENACLTVKVKEDLKVAKGTISTLESEAKDSAKEKSRLIANIKDDLKEAKGRIATQESDAKCSAKENACIIVNLNNDLNDAKGTIVTLESEAKDSAKESARLITKIKGDLKDAKGTIATLESKARDSAKENTCLIVNLKDDLKDAKGTIVTLESEAKDSAEENACIIANTKEDVKDAKDIIVALESEAKCSAKENACIIANIKGDLNEARGTIVILESEAKDSAKEIACIITNLKNDLKDAKGTIVTLESEAEDSAKESACQIANKNDDLKDAKKTTSNLQTTLDVTLVQNYEYLNVLQDLRGEMAITKKMTNGIEIDRIHLRDEMENWKNKCTRCEEELRNSTLLRSVGQENIRSLQNDLSYEQKNNESLRNETKILLLENNEIESKTTKIESASLELELETNILQRQLKEANSNITHLREVVARLESKIKGERIRISEQEDLRLMDGAKIQRLEGDLEKLISEKVEQTKTTRKLAKLLKRSGRKTERIRSSEQKDLRSIDGARIQLLEGKLEKAVNEMAEQSKTTRKLAKLLTRTMNSVTRVSRMKMNVDLCYFDGITSEYRQMPAKAEYSGSVFGSKPHGAGMMTFECGDMYLGTFENGAMSGEGSYIAATHNTNLVKGKGKLQFKGLYDYNETRRHRNQH